MELIAANDFEAGDVVVIGDDGKARRYRDDDPPRITAPHRINKGERIEITFYPGGAQITAIHYDLPEPA